MDCPVGFNVIARVLWVKQGDRRIRVREGDVSTEADVGEMGLLAGRKP